MNCIINCVTNLDETSNYMANIISFLGVIVACIAVCYSVAVARMNIRSNSRQAWINQLRSELVEFLSIVSKLTKFLQNNHMSEPEVLNEYEMLLKKIQMVSLLINKDKTPHTKLLNLLKDTADLISDLINNNRSIFNNNQIIIQDIISKKEEIITSSQSIIKTEWEKVKIGK